MAKFDAGAVVEPLDYDFTTIPNWPKNMEDAKGTIAEPSDQQIGDFLEGMKAIGKDANNLGLAEMEELGTTGDVDPEVLLAAMDKVTGDDFVRLMQNTSKEFSKLCSGKPTQRQIDKLPLRVRVHFFAWIMNEVVRPEAGSAAGAQVLSLPQRAATG